MIKITKTVRNLIPVWGIMMFLMLSFPGYSQEKDSLNIDENTAPPNKNLYLTRQMDEGTLDYRSIKENVPASALFPLDGRSSSVMIRNFSGMPGEDPYISIRGLNTFIFNNHPAIILDGTPTDNISDLNYNDIAEVRILKDASSLAILGGQGANGALIITTKRGMPGNNRVRFSAAYGVQQVPKTLDMMSPEQSLAYMQDLNSVLVGTEQDKSRHFGNAFITDSLIDVNNLYNNDWQDVLFAAAPFQNYNLSFSGGTEVTKFLVSTSLTNTEGIVQPSSHQKINISFNLDHKISERLNIGTSIYLTRMQNRNVNTSDTVMERNVILATLSHPPFLPVEDDLGNYFINPLRPEIDNPNAYIDGIEDNYSRNSAIASFFLNYNILDALKLQINTSGNLALDRKDYFASTTKTYYGRLTSGYGIQEGREYTSWNTEALLNYLLGSAGNELDITAGVSYYTGRNSWNRAQGFGFSTDDVKLLSGAGTRFSMSNYDNYSRMAYLSRIFYSYDNKYLVRANVRAETSSRFSDREKLGLFYGADASWVISSENFMSDEGFISHLELNAGYGVTGNDGGNLVGMVYQRFINDTLPGLNPDEELTDLAYPGAGFHLRNIEDEGWEITTGINAGLVIGMIENRLTANLNWYSRNISDLILPDLTNPDILYLNGSEMNSSGIELELTGIVASGENFSWETGLYFSKLANEVVSTGNYIDGYTLGYKGKSNILLEGETAFAFWGYETDGIFSDQQEIDNHASQGDVSPGDIRYKNQNGDNVIDEQDKVIIGDPNPDFHYGFSNTFRLGNLELNLLLQGIQGAEKLNLVKMHTEGLNDFINQSADAAGGISEENLIPGVSTGENNVLLSDRFIEDASYLRLKQLSLGYYLPENFTARLGIASTYLYVTGYNLFTLTGYSGYDPETSSFGVLNIDYGAYPNARYIGGGIRIGF